MELSANQKCVNFLYTSVSKKCLLPFTAGFDRFFGSLSPIPAKEIFANKKSFRKFCPISTSETRQVSLLTVFRTPLHIKDFSDRAIAPTPMGPIRIDSGACKEELLAKEKSFLAFGATF